MRTYKIVLRNIKDFEKYADLFDKFQFYATISGESFCVDATDIMELFYHWPAESLSLTIKDLYTGNYKDVESYLKETGLLIADSHQIVQNEYRL